MTLILAPIEEMLARASGSLTVNREELDLIHRNTQRLLKLVNTLLDFSRIEAGRAQAAYERIDLPVFTADLASTFRSAIEKAGLRLIVNCPPLSESVLVDRGMWEKIVLNLLSNAFKFTFEGEVTVTLQKVGERVELSVSDTGTGVAEHEPPHLFERFHRYRERAQTDIRGFWASAWRWCRNSLHCMAVRCAPRAFTERAAASSCPSRWAARICPAGKSPRAHDYRRPPPVRVRLCRRQLAGCRTRQSHPLEALER